LTPEVFVFRELIDDERRDEYGFEMGVDGLGEEERDERDGWNVMLCSKRLNKVFIKVNTKSGERVLTSKGREGFDLEDEDDDEFDEGSEKREDNTE
jgi:hypothetical protein